MKARIKFINGEWHSRYIPLDAVGVGKTIPEAYKDMMRIINNFHEEMSRMRNESFGRNPSYRRG